ncbi:unnamed protein product [Cuscuta epithymum]|uniref:Uncharacterized protein n=1 Tax=Cuscuta epithymum TaxID=186058 RepID=A0AAV0EGM9_9ASTE|nr:unnamed protein product [Cuscuta epithymum]CAH9123160.1 unnamed protein product [Cuscuta epithymum]
MVEQLIGDISHGPNYLIGRRGRSKKRKESPPNISKLKEEMADEMNKKIQHCLAFAITKLAADNPNLKVNVEELFAAMPFDVSNDELQDDSNSSDSNEAETSKGD